MMHLSEGKIDMSTTFVRLWSFLSPIVVVWVLSRTWIESIHFVCHLISVRSHMCLLVKVLEAHMVLGTDEFSVSVGVRTVYS